MSDPPGRPHGPDRPGLADADAFDRAYRKYAPSALRRARHLLGNDQDAYEVVHDVFVRLLERPDRYRGEAALSTFFYSSVTHGCLNRLRNRTTRWSLLRERFVSGLLRHSSPGTQEALVLLRTTLERMPEPLAEVAIYYHLDGLTQDEISTLLGCSRRQVGHHLNRIARWIDKQELAACRI
ncbi:MAG: sigma-70 family RNA polymerase sigma factor [Myxococcales bacterium]|nr:sigma-70 family RNA polymerase sigma factor [Myxococcales bacterium]